MSNADHDWKLCREGSQLLVCVTPANSLTAKCSAVTFTSVSERMRRMIKLLPQIYYDRWAFLLTPRRDSWTTQLFRTTDAFFRVNCKFYIETPQGIHTALQSWIFFFSRMTEKVYMPIITDRSIVFFFTQLVLYYSALRFKQQNHCLNVTFQWVQICKKSFCITTQQSGNLHIRDHYVF